MRMTCSPPASLLLVHGAGSGPWVFGGWADSFPGVAVVAVDLQEGLDVAAASHDDYADRVVAAAASLTAPIALCGWSMGGLVVLQASPLMQPDRVVLLEASAPAEVQGFNPETEIGYGTFDPEQVYGEFPEGMPARPESSRARAERKRGISVPALPCRSLVVFGDDFREERGTALVHVYGSDRSTSLASTIGTSSATHRSAAPSPTGSGSEQCEPDRSFTVDGARTLPP
jgi:pimeloyl-ACP methyl ester carboxylesterase